MIWNLWLRTLTQLPFVKLTYTEAVSILEEAAKEKKFENKVEWGIDLASEHERYLTEEKFKKPVIVYNYPKGIKAFYMKVNEDNKTVAAMDVLVPKVRHPFSLDTCQKLSYENVTCFFFTYAAVLLYNACVNIEYFVCLLYQPYVFSY